MSNDETAAPTNGSDETKTEAPKAPKKKSDRQRILESAARAILKAEATEDREAGRLTRKELDAKVRVEVKRTTGPSQTVGNAANAGVTTKVGGKTYRFVRVAPSTYGVEEVEETAAA